MASSPENEGKMLSFDNCGGTRAPPFQDLGYPSFFPGAGALMDR